MYALDQQLEAVLFYMGEPETRANLAKVLEVTHAELDEALIRLETALGERGIRLLTVQDQVELVTAPEASAAIHRLRKHELTRDLGKAGAETLAIVLYKGPISRAELDYIRGVNSSFIVRNLEVRGLVERVQNPDNKRQMLLQPTTELVRHLGLTSLTDLPDRAAILEELTKAQAQENQSEETPTPTMQQPVSV